LEDFGGKATRNRYYVRHFACGPAIPTRSERGWEADLTSRDRWKVLAALVWLGGAHCDPPPNGEADPQAEDPQDVALVRKVRGRKKVRARLQELARSKDRWTREAARLALNPKDSRF
jgi:hypothetical protein